MKRKHFAGLTCVGLMFGISVIAQATPVQFATNGHYYEVVIPTIGLTWDEAKIDAQARTGYLATVTNNEENSFIYTLLSSEAQAWGYYLGGYQPVGSREPRGNWSWVTGESFSYTNWNLGEPNNGLTDPRGPQNALWMYGDAATRYNAEYMGGKWDDTWGNESSWPIGNNKGYIVEYDTAPVPEPGSMLLIGMGLIGLIGARKRKAQ